MRRAKPTVKDVARAMKVSPSSISNAYHRPNKLSPELRDRILQAAERLGYDPDPSASGLRRRVTGVVGVYYKDDLPFAFTDPAFSLFLQGVAETIKQPGYSVLLSGTCGPGSGGGAFRRPAIDGVVWYAPPQHDPRVARLLQQQLPTVLVDGEPVPGVPSVTIEDVAGATALGSWLLDLGHRRIVVLSMPHRLNGTAGPVSLEVLETAEFRAVRARCAGYKAAARARGVPWREHATAWAAPANSIDAGREAGRAILSTPRRPTAIVCLSDQLAFGVLAAARDLGLTVPGDVSVAGFDDIPESARTHPPLTTVRQSHAEKGRLATSLLLEQIAGRRTPDLHVLPTELIVRASCGPAPQGKKDR